jgi:hypothetical protein
MRTDSEKFGDQLASLIRQPGEGARFSSASTRSAFAGGAQGTRGEASTQPDAQGKTKMIFLVGDPFTGDYYFPVYTPLNIFTATEMEGLEDA